MTTIYVDPNEGSDSNVGTSTAAPVATRQRASVIIGGNGAHQILVKSGSVETVAATFNIRSGTSKTARFYCGIYGGTAPATITCASDINDISYILSTSQFITIEDWDFDAANLTDRPLQIQASSNTVTDVILRRNRFRRSIANGLFINSADTSNPLISNIWVEDNEFSDNAAHGSQVLGEVNGVYFVGNTYARNSRSSSSHGATALPQRTTVTSGWTNTSGNIYSRAFTTATIYSVMTTNSTYPWLLQNTGTPTTPAAGEFGINAGTLYINIGTNPSGVSVSYAHTRCHNVHYLFNRVHNTQSVDTVEGTGIQFDDMASYCSAIGNLVYDNKGVGITSNGGVGNVIRSNIVFNNGRRGINAQRGGGHSIDNNTVLLNNQGIADASEISVSLLGTNTAVRNNIVLASVANGILCDAGSASGSTAANNNVRGNTGAAVSGLTDSTLTTSDPSLNNQYMPLASAVRSAGTYLGIKDFYGKAFGNTPTIGAVQYKAVRSRTMRTLVTRSVASRSLARRRVITV